MSVLASVFPVIILILGGAIFLSIWIAMQFSNAAKAKGYYQSRYFWLCFLFGLTGYLLVIALPDRNSAWKNQIPQQNGVNPGYQTPYQG